MKKKVLFFTNGLYGGGAEQILLTLLTHIDYTLFNITLYSLTKDDVTKEYPEQIHSNDSHIVENSPRSFPVWHIHLLFPKTSKRNVLPFSL